jgi:hypothetical protein
MRFGLLILVVLGSAAGCSCHHHNRDDSRQQLPIEPATSAAAPEDFAVAAALVFDPPVIANNPHLDLGRSARNPAAFVAYDQTITTFYYLRNNDRQIIDVAPFSERRALTESFGVSYR